MADARVQRIVEKLPLEPRSRCLVRRSGGACSGASAQQAARQLPRRRLEDLAIARNPICAG